jgi:hypothetical protein
MRTWNLGKNDPYTLSIAADASFTTTSYVDDQIWELVLGGGDPSALAFTTTYGLRANSLRLFPRFNDGINTVSDPQYFTTPPILKKILPNYLQVTLSPIPDIDVILEYLVPHSQGCCGRVSFINLTDITKTLRFEWIGLLTPRNGKRLADQEIDAVHVLTGFTDNLVPVIYLSKGARPGVGPYPSLSIELDLPPGDIYHVYWSEAALDNLESSFQLARSLTTMKWDAEIARIELFYSQKLDIRTDDLNWDAAFMLSQRFAFNVIHSPTKFLPCSSFVSSRLPDQGFSLLEDGSDYNFLWNGQTSLDSLFLSGILLPTDIGLTEGLLRNFLAIQDPSGFIDWKPGLGGQRSHIMVTPVLVTLTKRIFDVNQDQIFLEAVFDPLLRYFDYWFSPSMDFDKDGTPEWEHLLQTGMDDHPVYAPWSITSDGLDISTVESPGLLSLLYKEGQILTEFAAALGKENEKNHLIQTTQRLKNRIEKFYNPLKNTYSDRDRDTHTIMDGVILASNLGNGECILKQTIKPKSRLIISVINDGSHISRPKIKLFGKDQKRKNMLLELKHHQFKWYPGRGVYTTVDIFSYINKISIEGIDPTDSVNVKTTDHGFTDITQYLPLWAGIPDQVTADNIIKEYLQRSGILLSEYGLRTCVKDDDLDKNDNYEVIHPIWMVFFLDGLLNYGYRHLAADLMTRYIQVIIRQVRSEKVFRHYYHATTGSGLGEKNHLLGIIPIDCFLRILGLKFFGEFQVQNEGFNPFPWTVKVNYQGITVVKQSDLTTIIFPDGQTTQITQPAPQVVRWEHEPIQKYSSPEV